jgi:hypothetical protein
VAVGGAAIRFRQAAPGDEPHLVGLVEAQDRGAAAMQRGEDGIERRVVDVRQAGGAVKLVGELIERRLLVGAPRQHGFAAFTRGDVAGDLRRADDDAAGVFDRRNAQRHVDAAAVLALPDGLVVVETFAAPDAGKDFRFLVLQLRRDQDGDGFADDLVGSVAEQGFGGAVPADDNAAEVFADNGVA